MSGFSAQLSHVPHSGLRGPYKWPAATLLWVAGGETQARKQGSRLPSWARPFSMGGRACHPPSPPRASRSAAKFSRGIFWTVLHPCPAICESQLRATGACLKWELRRRLWVRSSREVGSPRLPWARRPGPGCRRLRRRPLPQTFPTGACVPGSFRRPGRVGCE